MLTRSISGSEYNSNLLMINLTIHNGDYEEYEDDT